MTSDLPWVDDEGDVDVPGGGKLAEFSDSHVLCGVAIQGGVVGGSQHELEVVNYHMLDVIDIHCMGHRL